MQTHTYLLLLLAASLAASVWVLVLAMRASALAACLVCITAVAILGVPFASWNVGPATISLDRLALLALPPFVLLQRCLTRQPRVQVKWHDLTLAGLLGLMAIQAIVIPWHTSHAADMPPWFRFGSSFAAPAVVYWVMRNRRAQTTDAGVITGFMACFGAYLAATAIAETHGLSAWVFPRYITADRTLYVGRAVGPFLSAPTLGTWLAISSAAVVLIIESSNGVKCIALSGLLGLMGYAEYLTATRSAWLGYLVVLAICALAYRSSISRPARVVWLTTSALVGALLVGRGFLLPSRAEGQSVVAQSTQQRLALLDGSVSLAAQRPLLGWGFGQFEHVIKTDVGEGLLGYFSTGAATGLSSHNIVLRLLVETGVVGLSLFAAVFWSWLQAAREALGDPAPGRRQLGVLFLGGLAAYLCESAFHDPTHAIPPQLLLFFLAGAMAGGSDGSNRFELLSASVGRDANRLPNLNTVRPTWSKRHPTFTT